MIGMKKKVGKSQLNKKDKSSGKGVLDGST